jgi:hypothetical protein
MGIFDNLTDKELLELAKRIRPVVDFHGMLFYLRIDLDVKKLRGTSFLWNAAENMGDTPIGIEELTLMVGKFTGATALFKPSIAEVLSQIPKNLLPEVVAFEIPDQLLTANSGCESMFNGKWVSYHVATVRLYKKREKSEG